MPHVHLLSKAGANSFLSFANLLSFSNANHTKTKAGGPVVKSTYLRMHASENISHEFTLALASVTL